MAHRAALPLRALREAQSLREGLVESTLVVAMERYCIFMETRPRGWKPGTAKTQRLAMRQLLGGIGDRPTKSLTMDDTDTAMVMAYSGGYSPQWVQYLRDSWGAFVRWLIRQRVLTLDVSLSWEPVPKDPDDHQRVFHDYTPEELTLLCRHMPERYGRLVWIACYAGGLREANLLALTWEKITEDWVIVIPASEMKGGVELRWPCSARLREILGPRGAPGEKVIPGMPRSRSKVWAMLKKASRRAGLPPEWAYVHQFRRTCCAWLQKAGVTRDQAQTLFGWKSEDVMLNSYWPRTNDDERRAILDKMT